MNRAQDFILIGYAYLWLYEFLMYGDQGDNHPYNCDESYYLAQQLYVDEVMYD